MKRSTIVAAIAALLVGTASAQAGGWHPPRPAEAVIVTEQYERTRIYVRYEEPAPRPTSCIDYKHAIWVHGHAIVTDREACRWPDGTLRNGPRPY